MIQLTKLNGQDIYINPHLVETMDSNEIEVRIHFISGKVLIVKEPYNEIIKKIVDYRKRLGINAQDI